MTAPENACPVCHLRAPHRPQVCDVCRLRLPLQLHEIAILMPVIPAALVDRPGSVIDLTMPPTGGAGARAVHDPHGDQTGLLPVHAVLVSWADDWATRRHESHQDVSTVFRAAKWLHLRLDWACNTHEAVGDFAAEIRALLASVRRAISRDLSPIRFAALCPYGCGQTLIRYPGADWIDCEGCRRTWAEDEYALLARASLDPDELLTTSEAALLATSVAGRPVSPDRIRQWAHRGKLEPSYPNGPRQPWYRKGQIEQVASGNLVSLG